MRAYSAIAGVLFSTFVVTSAYATVTGVTSCTGANACTITTTPPTNVSKNPNDGILLLWDEVQNFVLTSPLRVDEVFDANATFVSPIGGSDFNLAAGTLVSSHMIQWDPGQGSDRRVNATVEFDSQILALITNKKNLNNSDTDLGAAGTTYDQFNLRGLERADSISFSGSTLDLSWRASSPGDWTRVITAFSPASNLSATSAVPVPASGLAMLALAPMAAWVARRHRR